LACEGKLTLPRSSRSVRLEREDGVREWLIPYPEHVNSHWSKRLWMRIQAETLPKHSSRRRDIEGDDKFVGK
jgi:hypothetical protein